MFSIQIKPTQLAPEEFNSFTHFLTPGPGNRRLSPKGDQLNPPGPVQIKLTHLPIPPPLKTFFPLYARSNLMGA